MSLDDFVIKEKLGKFSFQIDYLIDIYNRLYVSIGEGSYS